MTGLFYVMAPRKAIELYFAEKLSEIPEGSIVDKQFRLIMFLFGFLCLAAAGFLCIGEQLQNSKLAHSAAAYHAVTSSACAYIYFNAQELGVPTGPILFWVVFHAMYAACYLTAPRKSSKKDD